MRELALHILDLIENSIAAGATVVSVEIVEDPERDVMRIAVEDDGPGLSVPPEQATNPFYTTKTSKKMGLGLSLFRFRIEQAGGELTLERSRLGGLAVRATLRLGHVDRSPLGDVASTLSSVVATNPEVELRCRMEVGGREQVVLSREVSEELTGRRGSGRAGARAHPLAVARRVRDRIREGLEALQIKE